MRKFSKDCNVGGYHILKGTWMAVNLWKANFGLSIMQLVLANLLHAFYFSNVNDQEVDMTGSAGLANIKLTPFDVLVAPRLSPSLLIGDLVGGVENHVFGTRHLTGHCAALAFA
ncbi:hypothetical protein ACS0TY_018839 [Phlomoides rotata]